MPQELMEGVFFTWLWGTAALWSLILATVVLTFILPRTLVTTYFTEPYFKPGEIHMLTGFPFGFIRTFMLMRVVANPSSGANRGLDRAYLTTPRWFRVLAEGFLAVFYGVVSLLFTALVVLGLGLLVQ